ncbi:ribosome assembly factor SBDS [Candidatus Pacearchaeota archaeon]|nr:ribosome assembly factor SBDS [Candidatus Pacearchaeota archaeon]
MISTIARIKKQNKHFEVLVDLDKALKLKDGNANVQETLLIDAIFTDHKKGLKAAKSDLEKIFGTDNIYDIASKIIKEGEVQLPTEYKSKEREDKFKQVVDFIVRSTQDARTSRPFTAQQVSNAIHEAGIVIDNRPVNAQIMMIIQKLREIIPLKTESKRLNLKIPPEYTGMAYGLLQDFKEKEEWMNDGTLVCIINVPSGLIMDFYDKINSISHGNIIVEELK